MCDLFWLCIDYLYERELIQYQTKYNYRFFNNDSKII